MWRKPIATSWKKNKQTNKLPILFYPSSPSQQCGMQSLKLKNPQHSLSSFSFFHHISNQYYLLSHSSFNILNYASQSSSVFLSKLVSLWINLYTIFSIELYCVSYFINYIYYESINLWPSMIHELYERCYKKFGFLQSFT